MYEKLLLCQESKLWNAFMFIVKLFSILSGAGACLLIFSAAVARYIFHSDIYGVEEVILALAFWLYFWGAVRGSSEDSHIKADLLDVYLTNHRVKYLIKTFAKVIEFAVYCFFSKWAVDLIITNIERMPRTTGLKIPFLVAQAPIAIGIILMAVLAFYYIALYLSYSMKNVPRVGRAQ